MTEPFNYPYFPFYWRDYLSSRRVSLMSLAAQGLYVRLLCLSWPDGSLPASLADISTLAGNPVEFKALWVEVGPMFKEHNGRLINERLDEIRGECRANQQSKREAGLRTQAKLREAKQAKLVAELVAEHRAEGIAKVQPPSASASAYSEPPTKPNPKKTPESPPAPLPFDSDEFREAWGNWESSRKESRKPIGPTARKQQCAMMAGWGESRSIAALRHSTSGGYQGLFEPRLGVGQEVKRHVSPNYNMRPPDDWIDQRALDMAAYLRGDLKERP